MYILMDTREHDEATAKIEKWFRLHNIPYERTKLRVGDYQDIANPFLVVDRKKDFEELSKNCASKDHERFRNEMIRAKATGTKIVVLVEQNWYMIDGKRIDVESIADLMLWESRYSTIRGEKVYRVLCSWIAKYDIEVQFCDKRSTGRRIVEILEGSK